MSLLETICIGAEGWVYLLDKGGNGPVMNSPLPFDIQELNHYLAQPCGQKESRSFLSIFSLLARNFLLFSKPPF